MFKSIREAGQGHARTGERGGVEEDQMFTTLGSNGTDGPPMEAVPGFWLLLNTIVDVQKQRRAQRG